MKLRAMKISEFRRAVSEVKLKPLVFEDGAYGQFFAYALGVQYVISPLFSTSGKPFRQISAFVHDEFGKVPNIKVYDEADLDKCKSICNEHLRLLVMSLIDDEVE